jgi:hypothetical protein
MWSASGENFPPRMPTTLCQLVSPLCAWVLVLVLLGATAERRNFSSDPTLSAVDPTFIYPVFRKAQVEQQQNGLGQRSTGISPTMPPNSCSAARGAGSTASDGRYR